MQQPMTEAATLNSGPGSPMKVHIDPGWRALVEEICVLKDALDHAFRWHGDGGNEKWINDALRPYGLDLQDFAEGSDADGPHFPEEFVKMLLGDGFWSRDLQPITRLMEIPPWAVLGWVRKSPYKATPSLSREELQLAAFDANQWDGTESYTHVWTGFPLYLAGEGKNRAQLQRLAGVDRLALVFEHDFPDVPGFTASPVPFFPWAVAIRSDTRPVQVLPLREITEKLVVKLGMKWDPTPSWGALWAFLRQGDSPLRILRWALHDWRNRPGHPLRLRLIGGNHLGGGARIAQAVIVKPSTPSS